MGLFSSQLPAAALAPLCRQLSTTYNAGIPIIRGLEVVAEQCGNRQAGRVLHDMARQIVDGATLEQAARDHAELPPLLVELLASGEKGGQLDTMLTDLADYYEDRVRIQRMVLAAALYPLLQLVAAWFLGTFALGAAKGIGASFDLWAYLSQYAQFQAKALGVFAIIMAGLAALSRTGILGWIIGRVTTSVWPLAPVTRRFALARFFRTFSLLISSGLGITDCIRRAASTANNPYIERDLLKAVPRVRDGMTLSQAFQGSKHLTRTAREMIAVGEQSGGLDQTLRKVSEYHLAEANQAVRVAAVAGGVAVFMIVAGIIGYVVISFYANLYGGLYNELGI